MEKKIIISDPTLRDGNHAIGHQLSTDQIASYCMAADAAGIDIVEVGHGNGLGASSLQLGESATPDDIALKVARANLKKSKLGIHIIPGFATIERDLEPALNLGVDVVRVASHCSEADITERHIGFARRRRAEVWGCLMMSHMISPIQLLEQAKKMESYGAEGKRNDRQKNDQAEHQNQRDTPLVRPACSIAGPAFHRLATPWMTQR